MVNANSIEVFNASFERCGKEKLFLDTFYELLISCSEEIREKFRDTDMRVQKETLMISLSYMMMACRDPEILARTAEKHNIHNRDIPPHLYQVWLDCMLQAVSQTDPAYEPRIGQAWREVLRPGIDYMIGKYRD